MDAPVAEKIERKIVVHGHELVDNYFWLREKENNKVIDYLNAENEYTDHIMKDTKEGQERLYNELKGRIKESDESVPAKWDDYYYFTRTVEGLNYPIYLRKKDDIEKVLLDQNQMDYKYNRLSTLAISPNHKLVAYTLDITGYESFTLYVKSLENDEIIETIENVSGDITWGTDNVFYYTINDKIHRPYAVKTHILGTDATTDRTIFEEPDETRFVGMGKDFSRQYLIVQSDSITSSEAWYLNLNNPEGELTCFLKRTENHEYELDYHEGYFYIISNENAKNFKIMRTKVDNIERENWEEFREHNPDEFIQGLTTFEKYIVIHKRVDGLNVMEVLDIENSENNHILELPEPIYSLSSGINYEYKSKKFRISYSSMITPETTYEYDFVSRELKLLKQQEVKGHNPADYVSVREYALAEDGTKIPMSIVHKKGLNKNAPALLYGYGSYGITISASFSSPRLSLLERGMVYAIAHIRGSSYLGKQWYEDGKLMKKKNTFTDFVSCAEHMIKIGLTSPEKLAIMGGSAGGLLMGATLNLRPDLFKLAIAAVPFVDVINTMLDASIPLTTHEYVEWGNPEKSKEAFEYMLSYSPYDNVEAKDYPAILVTAGLNDPRVHYWEPAKWTAKLRDLKTDKNTLILKTNMGAGHGGASGRYEYLKELAFKYAFMFKELGLEF